MLINTGGTEKKRKILKPSEKFQRIFQFEWEQDDDTAKDDMNPLYTNRIHMNTLFGRGYLAGKFICRFKCIYCIVYIVQYATMYSYLIMCI